MRVWSMISVRASPANLAHAPHCEQCLARKKGGSEPDSWVDVAPSERSYVTANSAGVPWPGTRDGWKAPASQKGKGGKGKASKGSQAGEATGHVKHGSAPGATGSNPALSATGSAKQNSAVGAKKRAPSRVLPWARPGAPMRILTWAARMAPPVRVLP